MNCTVQNESTERTIGAAELTELVRGTDRRLLDALTPVVRRENVSLDLSTVERIDAAGISALISLYCTATQSGHGFHVANVAPRVRELLSLVGLDEILLSQSTQRDSGSCLGLARNAA